MKLINVTNSHKRLVNKQLENTDAYFIKVYSAGSTTVVYTEAATHAEIVVINKKRALRKAEVNEILGYFLRKIPKEHYQKEAIEMIDVKGITEISIPLIRPIQNA